MWSRIECLLAWLLVAMVLLGHPASAQVKVYPGTLNLMTYEEGDPNPNPPFDQNASASRFNYPYTLRDNLTGESAPHSWRAIFLENEYLKCSVLPDLGGHLYTCMDKIAGRPMFYANPSIKKAEIGNRGAWAAFGLEFNFPVSHNWVSVAPVNYSYATHPDGSASVWIGNIDRVYGMQWQVELLLRPGSTLLEQHTILYNRSDVRHRYYWWSNAAIEVWDDSRVEYPMHFAASHGFTNVYPWPVGPAGKRDLSVVGNQLSGAVSFFAHGTREPFMGIWNPHTQSGTAHYADYRDVPAKKIWSWGADQDGRAWRKALSDNNSAYVEVQAGLFRNQETYAFLEPGQSLHFTEYWMPVRELGGITRANKAGAVYLHTSGSDLTVALNVNARLPGAGISLKQDDVLVWSGTSDLSPESTWSHRLVRAADSGKITFQLRNRDGQLLMEQTEGKYDLDPESSAATGPQQIEHLPLPKDRSEDDWLQAGRQMELHGALLEALNSYRKGLEQYAGSQSLMVAAGRLAASLQQYDESVRLLRKAQMRDTSNSEIAYYLGLAYEGSADSHSAVEAYQIAYRQADLRAPAAIRLAEIEARKGKLDDAAELLQNALATQPNNLRAGEELEAVRRAAGETAEADQLARNGLERDPASDFLKADTGSPDLAHLAADPYRLLAVSTEYIRIGLYKQALELLDRDYSTVATDQSEPGSVLPQANPLVRYYAAYCHQRLGGDGRTDREAASALSTSYVFPSTETDRVVLEAAVAGNPSDATAQFLLGTLLFSKGEVDHALAQWSRSKQLSPHRPVLDAAMGNVLLRQRHDPLNALAAFREGVSNDSRNSEVYSGLDQAMSALRLPAAERASALAQYPQSSSLPASMPANLVYLLALARAEAGQFGPALALFKDRYFPSEEGGISAAQVQFEVERMQAQTWAESGGCAPALAFFRKAKNDNWLTSLPARNQVQLATIAHACGAPDEAVPLLTAAAASTGSTNVVWALQAGTLLGSVTGAQARQRLLAVLAETREQTESDPNSGFWCYQRGLVAQALGERAEAATWLERSLVLPERNMSRHLARLALESKDASH